MSREMVVSVLSLILYFPLIECVSPLWIDLIPHKRQSSVGVSLWETEKKNPPAFIHVSVKHFSVLQ